MQIDKTKLAAQIEAQTRRLEQLKLIASDPELAALLETVMVNGDNRPVAPVVQNIETPRTTVVDVSGPPKKGAQLAAIQSAAISHERPFSGYQLAQYMLSTGYKFQSSVAAQSTIDGLKSLLKKGVVKVHRKGKGGSPTLYIRAHNPDTEAQ